MAPGHLEAAVGAAADAQDACKTVVDHLFVLGLMPSAYLVRGGRLRCQAVRGYTQILDGMPPRVGVLGRTFATGETIVVRDTGGSPDYIAAVAGVVAEACVPVRCAGEAVGALNVESRAALTEADVAELTRCALLLGARLEQLGGGLVESASQRLVRHVAHLTGITDVDELERSVLEAATDVARLESAMLLRVTPDGLPVPRRATGPLAEALLATPEPALRTVASFVASGTSCYTIGHAGGQGFRAAQTLRVAGVARLITLAIGADGVAPYVLLLADRAPGEALTDTVELLELLCAQAASSLRVAGVMRELRELAATDPLTGLGHHATFHAELERARSRGVIAVVLADVDGFKAINDTLGHQAGDRTLAATAAALSSGLRRGDELFRIGGDEFAALVEVVDEREALAAGRRLRGAAAAAGSVTVSVGIAIPSEGESTEMVLARADRALYAVKASGRDDVVLSTAP